MNKLWRVCEIFLNKGDTGEGGWHLSLGGDSHIICSEINNYELMTLLGLKSIILSINCFSHSNFINKKKSIQIEHLLEKLRDGWRECIGLYEVVGGGMEVTKCQVIF